MFAQLYQNSILKNPKSVFVVLLIVLLSFGYHSKNFKLDASSETLLIEGDPDLKYLQEISKRYGSKEFLILTYTPKDEMISESSINNLLSLKYKIQSLDWVHSVVTLLDVPLLNNSEAPLQERLENFKTLKKQYSKGSELRGKTLGIVGFGRIGRSLASYALGCGMKVVAHDRFAENGEVEVHVGDVSISVDCQMLSMEEVLKQSDAVSLHIPAQADGQAVIDAEQLAMMKPGAILLNAARGGVVDEDALIDALNSGQISGAALDVFVGEPSPRADVLAHPAISLTPHTGAATGEAQDRIGLELAAQIAELV